jgi:hypothetical protein
VLNREERRDRMGRRRGRAVQEKENGGGKRNCAIEGMAREGGVGGRNAENGGCKIAVDAVRMEDVFGLGPPRRMRRERKSEMASKRSLAMLWGGGEITSERSWES